MSKKLIYLISFVLLLGVLQAVPAEAQSFEFGGTVTSVYPGMYGCDPPWDNVNVNDQWFIKYTFDPTTPDTDGASDHGWYAAITSYTLNVGGNVVYDSGLAGELISIFSNRPVGWDQYEVWISLPNGYQWFMQLDDDTGTAWDTDELPLCGDIELSNFGLRDFTLSDFGGPGDCEISGSVDYHRCSSCTPLEAYNPSPADDANCVGRDVVLTWSPGCSAVSHYVHFGVDPGALALVGIKMLGDESYAPGLLELGTTYYWRINESDGTDIWVGDVWSFTTRGLLFGDVELKPLGQAQLAIVDSNLVVSNIGSSGEDGVQCTRAGGLKEFKYVTVEFENLNSAPVGTTVVLTQKGTMGIGSEDTDRELAALVVTKAASDEWTAITDLTPVDVDSYQYQVFNDVNFAGVIPGGPGSTITMPTGPVEIGGGFEPMLPPGASPCFCGSSYIQGVLRYKPAWWKKSGTNTKVCACPSPPGPWPGYSWDWISCCDCFIWKIDVWHVDLIYGGPPEFLELIGNRIDVVGLENRYPSELFRLDITAANTSSITITDIRASFRECKLIIAGDIDGNCRVDFNDFAMMANNWLEDRTTWEP